MFLTIDCATCA